MIDVIIPVYKAEKTLPKTLASIMEQSILDKLKIYLVIDGDENAIYDYIAANFNVIFDNKICIIKSHMNEGPGYCRQLGIENSDSDYFTFIDADDTYAGAYSLELLSKVAKENPNASCIVGNFAEEQPGLKFFTHPNDSVWVFGKLYRRSFIEKYNIRFNSTRANEDTGFNTKVKLLADKDNPILSVQDIVYYWHYREDSITRKNNCEYSYGESFVGYVDNMIDAIKFAKSTAPSNGYIEKFAIQTMVNLYIYWLQTDKRDSKFSYRNFSYCAKYYKEIFSDVMDKLRNTDNGSNILKSEFAKEYHSRANELMDICPGITFFEFLENLSDFNDEEKKEEEVD